ncbi:hypothetical protein G039_0330100 [Pseudomonas aeruginosa VRFPA01]|nr:hypothetical protein G039_0330100 [Pseudomonas aeruginosa VRFPA01]
MKHFKLPDLGEGLQEAEIVEWHVKSGDSVRADQRLVSVETAKALVDIPAPYDGVVGKLFGAEGDILHVGEPLVGFEGEEADAGTVVGRLEGGGSAPEDRFFIGAAAVHPRAPGAARALGAQGRGQPRGGDAHARYDKYSLTLSYLQPFQLWGERFSFDSLATGQRSEDVLFSPQRISLGGNSSVRGFKDQTLTGDSGGYWRNQLRWRRAVQWAPLRPWLQEYGVAFAYDVGVIRHDRYNDGASGRMSGNAIELDARGRYFAASVGFARSLERPSVIERREHPIYFRVDAFF